MKKTTMFLGMLSLGLAHAQQDTNGKVGINTEAPQATLNVKSKTGTTASTKNLELENASGKKLVTVLDNGMVGINQPTPIAPLHIISPALGYANDIIIEDYTSIASDPSAFIFNRNRGNINAPESLQPGDYIAHLIFATKNGNKNATPAANRIAEIGSQYKGDGSNTLGNLYFNTTGQQRMLLTEDGKVGIGTSQPSAHLDVKSKGTSSTTKNLELENFSGTKLLTVLDNGFIGVANETPISPLHIVTTAGGYANDLILEDYSTTNDSQGIVFNRNKGNRTNPTKLNTEDPVGQIVFATKDGNVNNTLANVKLAEIRSLYKSVGKGNLIFSTSLVDRMSITEEGKVQITDLKGTGDRPIYADANGVLKIGNATSSNTPSNIYTTDGTVQGSKDRTLTTATGKSLIVKGDNWFPLQVSTTNTETNGAGGGGIAIHPNNLDKRFELSVTQNGDFRIWGNGFDRINISKEGIVKVDNLKGQSARPVYATADGTLKAGTPIKTVNANYNLDGSDDNGYVYVESNNPTTITIPSNLPEGFSCVIVQQGNGQVTIAGQGVNIQTARGTKTRTQYSAIGVIKRTSNTATITGDAIN